MALPVDLDLQLLNVKDIPDASSPEFDVFLNTYFDAGTLLADSMDAWAKHSTKAGGTVEILHLNTSSSMKEIRNRLGIKEYWCGRISHHQSNTVSQTPGDSVAEPHGHDAAVVDRTPKGIYERFRSGLLVHHSQHEQEYIEAFREAECLQVFRPGVAEVWRMTYEVPPPTNPRTFVELLLTKELEAINGQRRFMNISLPIHHEGCLEKQGPEKSRVRGKYVSVERVTESGAGQVEWRMATSSDAGGNIPRFLTNSSLPSSIAEDVPSFVKWLSSRYPEEEAAGE